jgi:hypothetical protein
MAPQGTLDGRLWLAGAGRFLLACLLLQLTLALAASWTIQTVAFPDYRQAVETVETLQELGFDAYVEFTMSGDGRQFSRVRIGCFAERHGAEAFARSLRGAVTQHAVIQPLNAGAGVSFCLRDEVGFVKPAAWGIERQSSHEILFRVSVAGHTGFIRRAAGQWQLLPEPEAVPAAATARQGTFRQHDVSGVALVGATLGDSDKVVCPGRLLWQNGSVAIVERSDSVVACIVEEDYRQFLP